MAMALTDAGMVVERQKRLTVYYRGRLAGEYLADVVVNGRVLLELKASRELDPSNEAQTLN